MKTILFLVAVTIGMMTAACSGVREKTAEEMLENPKMEDEIYSAILADTSRFEKLIERMMFDEDCKAMMMGNDSLIKIICSSDKMFGLMNHDIQMMESMTTNLMNIVERDSVVCDKTCAKMMESDRFRKHIMEHAKVGHAEAHEK